MKISNIQKIKHFQTQFLIVFCLAFFSSPSQLFADGGGNFKAKCASCHQPHKNGTGPKLFQVREKWSTGGAKEGSIYQWVNNWQTAAANDTYAAGVSKWSATAMNAFPELTKVQIDEILDWVDAQPDPATAGPAGGAATDNKDGASTEASEKGGTSWLWIFLSVLFITIILSVGGVRRQLKISAGESSSNDHLTYAEEFKAWAWKYRLPVGLGSLVILLAVIVTLFQGLSRINVVENYQPSQPIAFPHDKHAGVNGIDCKYCHNSVEKSKSAGIPSVNVCMNCHKQINGEGKPYAAEIKKIYSAAGYDPAGSGKYTGNTKPIVWNKVHVLPDHVYFNHSQHVVVGGVDCKQCHGDMTKMKETAKVQPVSELNKIEGNIKLSKPTLTMGWCIECHGAKEVSLGDGKNGYYDEIHRRLKDNDKSLYKKYLKDGKVTVSELGGWECAKCHY